MDLSFKIDPGTTGKFKKFNSYTESLKRLDLETGCCFLEVHVLYKNYLSFRPSLLENFQRSCFFHILLKLICLGDALLSAR